MSDVYGSDHCPVKSSIALDIIPSTKLPALCTKYFKEFSGKQLKMSTFVCKRTLAVEQPNEIQNKSEGSEPKKMRLSLKTTKQAQSSLLKFFSSGTVKESVSSLNSHFVSSKEGDKNDNRLNF
jgi:hypothetical protein